ncbi:MAG TPA: type IV toxin-antitoxin system AbiEi family antitoxin domain-containing protein [Solirubrobacteraceae bacterium]|nr:type IV toxin-antitoxin system AbiEi family antitoxin domain-containing protein [Solirubrobacteraceae bacterium]
MAGEGADRRAAGVAARQKTIVTTAQLGACGLGRRAIKYRVETGRLHPVFPGVYSFGCGELPPLGREQAALLAVGEHAFLSHETAAAVWRLVRTLPERVEVSVVGRYRASNEGISVHRIKKIDRSEVRREQGLWVSSPARAVLEIAATATDNELTRAIDEGLAGRLFTPRALDEVLARNRPCRGAARLAAILGDPTATATSRSTREKALLRLIREAGLPMPETNVPFGRFELDFYWRREGLVVELDSETFHRGPGAVRRDREKDLAVKAARLEMLRLMGDHVLKRPSMVLATIAGELARLGG